MEANYDEYYSTFPTKRGREDTEISDTIIKQQCIYQETSFPIFSFCPTSDDNTINNFVSPFELDAQNLLEILDQPNEEAQSRKAIKMDMLSMPKLIAYEQDTVAELKVDPPQLPKSDTLRESGFIVLPLLTDVRRYEQDLWDEVKKFPEYINPNEETRFVGGSFGAMGNPSSFHNPTVRKLRLLAMQQMIPFFKDLDQGQGMNLEQLIDRLALRKKGHKLNSESWHRDSSPSPYAMKDDIILGGWINIDPKENQYLSCIPTSHRGDSTVSKFLQSKFQIGVATKGGFSKVPARLLERRQHTKEAEEFQAYMEDNKCTVAVPPGHIIMFYQGLLHEVMKTNITHNAFRLYIGWRLTPHFEPMFCNTDDRLKKQAPMLIPSAQASEMYGGNWRSGLLYSHLIPWSNTDINDKCKIEIKCDPDKRSNTEKLSVARIVDQRLKGLGYYGFPMYPAYTKEEMQLFQPLKRF